MLSIFWKLKYLKDTEIETELRWKPDHDCEHKSLLKSPVCQICSNIFWGYSWVSSRIPQPLLASTGAENSQYIAGSHPYYKNSVQDTLSTVKT